MIISLWAIRSAVEMRRRRCWLRSFTSAAPNQGQHIDICAGRMHAADGGAMLIEQSAMGTVAPAISGRHPSCVPHGCFPVAVTTPGSDRG